MVFDKYGVLAMKQQDGFLEGGDSLAWTGHYEYFNPVNFLEEKREYLKPVGDSDTLEPCGFFEFFSVNSKGWAFTRHPVPKSTFHNGFGAYYKNPWDGIISRDQLTGPLCFAVKTKKFKQCFKILIHAMAWFCLFTYNTRNNNPVKNGPGWKLPDFTGPDIWSFYLRGTLGWFSVLPNIFFDLHGLLSSIHYNIVPSNDNINFAIKSVCARECYPTPLSLLSWKIINKEKLKREYRVYFSKRYQYEMGDYFLKYIEEL